MSTWPAQNDVFIEPSSPESTPLSSAGTGNWNHTESHREMGDAIERIEELVALEDHDHSGESTDPAARPGPKLKQANTHEESDTDASNESIHHTLGKGEFQAASGIHTHEQSDIIGLGNYICTSGTRPTGDARFIGLQIYETDTNQIRVWTRWGNETTPRWVLLLGGSVPICRLLQGTAQQVINTGSIIEWRIEEEDNFNMFNVSTSMTEIVIKEPGLYSVDASVSWSPDRIFGDNAYTRIMINGQPTTRIHGEFVRGRGFTPGFSQNVDLGAKVRLKANDRLSIQASHNGFISSWTWSSSNAKQDSRLDLSYISP